MSAPTRAAILAMLEDLEQATNSLIPADDAAQFNLDRVEKSVSLRQNAVARLEHFASNCPNLFTEEDVERIRRAQAIGKAAYQKLIEIRQTGWTTSMELTRKNYLLRTFARFGVREPC